MNRGPLRTSLVGQVFVDNVIFASSVFAGDMVEFSPKATVLAIQREVPNFYGDEGDLSHFPIFTADIPVPVRLTSTKLEIVQTSPFIRVGGVYIIAISTSALFHIGANRSIRAESRIKHIRHLLTGERAPI